jgi:hypothetical protein
MDHELSFLPLADRTLPNGAAAFAQGDIVTATLSVFTVTSKQVRGWVANRVHSAQPLVRSDDGGRYMRQRLALVPHARSSGACLSCL